MILTVITELNVQVSKQNIESCDDLGRDNEQWSLIS